MGWVEMFWWPAFVSTDEHLQGDNEPEMSLESLLAQVTADTIHHEVDTGPPTGVEEW